MAKKVRIRSERRARVGWRSLLVLILLYLLLVLIGRIIGFRIGGESPRLPTAAPRQVDSANEGDRRVSPVRARPEEVIGGDRPANADVEGAASDWNEELDAEPPSSVVEGGFLQGPSWLRLRLPTDFELERTKILVEAVHADLPGLRGKKVLRTAAKRAPDEIILLVDAVPGGIWIELLGEGVRELQGPFATEPFQFQDLGRLQSPDGELAWPRDRKDLWLAPELVRPPGWPRSIYPRPAPVEELGPITCSAASLDAEVLRLRGPWEWRRIRSIKTPLVDDEGEPEPGELLPLKHEMRLVARGRDADRLGLVDEMSGGLDIVELPPFVSALLPSGLADLDVLATPEALDLPLVDGFRLALAGGSRPAFESQLIFSSVGNIHCGQSPAFLSLPRALLDRVRPLRVENGASEQDRLESLSLDLLLLDSARLQADPDDPDRVFLPVQAGRHEIFDLGRLENGRPARLAEVEIDIQSPLRFTPNEALLSLQLLGRVVAAEDGAPISGAEIVVVRAGDELPEVLPGLMRSDAQGGFECRGLPEGELRIEARAPGYRSARVEAQAGLQTTQPIVLALVSEPGMVVHLRSPDGASSQADLVAAVGRDGRISLAEVDADGHARFPRLSPGRYALLPVIGEAPLQIDGWDWLGGQFGATILDHPRAEARLLAPGEEDVVVLTTPVPRSVILDLEPQGQAAPDRFDLMIIPENPPLAPGLWLRITKSGVDAGPLAIDGLPPGRYRAVANLELASAIADFEVPERGDAALKVVLDFD